MTAALWAAATGSLFVLAALAVLAVVHALGRMFGLTPQRADRAGERIAQQLDGLTARMRR